LARPICGAIFDRTSEIVQPPRTRAAGESWWRRSPGERAQRHRRRRAWPVVSLALEKRLFLNVRRKRLLVSPFGKKLCDINERLNPF